MERDPRGTTITAASAGGDAADRGDDRYDDDDDVVVVLAWWQHPVNVIGLVVATALCAAMIGWLVATVAAEPDASDVDVGFLQDMRIHHEQAVHMGFIYLDRPATDPAVEIVARDIVYSQAIDIGRMILLLRTADAPEAAETDSAMAWMGMATTHDEMPGMATKAELDALAQAQGAPADELFVELMVAHHRGGIHMAEHAAEHASSGDVRAMAAAMVRGQSDEIAELEQLALLGPRGS